MGFEWKINIINCQFHLPYIKKVYVRKQYKVKELKTKLKLFLQEILNNYHISIFNLTTLYQIFCKFFNFFFKIMDQKDQSTSKTELSLGSMTISKPQYQVLLIFPKEDRYFRLMTAALGKLEFKYESAKTIEDANKKFVVSQHHLVVVDCRHGCSTESEFFCRNVRENFIGSFTTIVALTARRYNKSFRPSANNLQCFLKCSKTKRSQVEENFSVKDLLRMGFNRVITETTILDDVEDELMQIEAEPLANQTKFRSCQALFTALERTTYLILIADEKQKIQYANKMFEHSTGISGNLIIGNFVSQFFTVESRNEQNIGSWDQIKEQMQNGKEWSGRLCFKHQNQDEIQLQCLLLPLSCQSGLVQQYVMVMNVAHQLPEATQLSRSVLETCRRGSGTSDQLRNLPQRRPSTHSEGDYKARSSSLAKIQSMAIEAPITQIIKLIDQVKHNSQPSVGEVLDQILEILRNSELYSPADLPNKSQDPMVSDLIEGLVTVG